MNIEAFQQFCLSLPHTTEELPFGPDTLVYKVQGKMFALTSLDSFSSINLKCAPEEAIELRERYAAVTPGYHMNKKHWNSIAIDNSISDTLLKKWIRNSYDLVAATLPKKR
jgi:predicted DNA-binding protein (MmcQ/YjbR family)